MALSFARIQDEAAKVKSVSERVVALLADVNSLLEHNSDQAIDWGAAQTPAYITEDESGNISGQQFSRQAVANAIGSLDQVRRLLTGLSVSQGDHLGNLNVVSAP